MALRAARRVVLALGLALAGSPPSAADPSPKLPAGAAEGLLRWRAALAQPGGAAIADATRLPFLFEGRRLERAAFIAEAVPALFTPARRHCLQEAAPQVEDGRVVLWCGPYAFYLGAGPGGWKLVEFAADPED